MSDKPAAGEHPAVTIILPMRNEEKWIAACIESILRQDYPRDRMEVLLVDGMSTDRSREIVSEYAQRHPFLKLVDNPERIQVTALNAGIRAATGDYVLRMDAHSQYGDDYVSKCVYYAQKTRAENVGGPVVTCPGADTLMARCIARITSHRLVVGGSAFRTTNKAQYADTCVFGTWRRELFDQIGLFNEALVRGEDNEFNSRTMRYGGRIFMTPEIRIRYFNQATLRGLMRQAYGNGVYHILTMVANPAAFKVRYFAPFAFVLWLTFFGLLSLVHWAFLIPLLGACAAYALAAVAVALQIGASDDWRLALYVPPCMLGYHVAYGVGTLAGVVRFLVFGGEHRAKARRGSAIPDPVCPPRLGLNALSEDEIARL